MTSLDTQTGGAITLEPTSCRLCGSERYAHVLSASDQGYGIPGTYQLVRCADCGLCYLNPRPTEASIPLLYPEHYGPHVDRGAREPAPEPGWKAALKSRLALWHYRGASAVGDRFSRLLLWPIHLYARLLRIMLMPPHAPGARVLDVGCGRGDFLVARRLEGWDTFGVEPSPRAAEIARRRTGGTVVTGSLADGRFAEASFDLVTLFHVLEHVSDPQGLMREVHRVLKPGGYMLIMLPNVESLELKLFGRNWQPLEIPRHLLHFSKSTVLRLLRQTGFEVVELAYLIEAATIDASLRNRFDLPRHAALGFGWVQVHRACWLASYLLAQLGRSAVMLVYARKPGGAV